MCGIIPTNATFICPERASTTGLDGIYIPKAGVAVLFPLRQSVKDVMKPRDVIYML
jgi:hypothetical protein